ncbi:MAG TPA: hypothetical protein VEC11_10420 [Allosphingosinicella sp.]|nr:hypothetical protein [Allosphingosinicella sp.]
MRFTKPLAAAISLSMMSAPVLAQSAAPLSLAPVGAQLNEPSGLDGDGYILPAVIIFGVLAAAILFTSNDDDDLNNPVSP